MVVNDGSRAPYFCILPFISAAISVSLIPSLRNVGISLATLDTTWQALRMALISSSSLTIRALWTALETSNSLDFGMAFSRSLMAA